MNSTPNWTVHVAKRARKVIARAPKQERNWLLRTLDEMALDPMSGNVKRLTNEQTAFARRLGDYRIFGSSPKSVKVPNALLMMIPCFSGIKIDTGRVRPERP